MSGWIRGAWQVGKAVLKKQKTTGQTVNPFKFTPSKTKGEKQLRKLNVDLKKDTGKFKKSWGKTVEKIDETSKQVRQALQKLKGEKVTESGVSKGKDIKK
tara:strand:- start:78 stop:377 length:300 start_codon:yes stop_codon:yes gene_type:complete